MFTEEDLLKKNNILDIKNVSLSLYRNFFKDILCKKIFLYTAVDGTQIKLIFKENDFMHILGAQHILGDSYKSGNFNLGIDDGSMTFEELEKRDNIAFNDCTNRFCGFANIYSVLTSCAVVYFDKKTYTLKLTGDSTMDFKYLLFEDIGGQKIHLGIDTYNKGKTFYGKSLLVTSIQNTKLIDDQTPLNIKQIDIIERGTQNILEKIIVPSISIDIAQITRDYLCSVRQSVVGVIHRNVGETP